MDDVKTVLKIVKMGGWMDGLKAILKIVKMGGWMEDVKVVLKIVPTAIKKFMSINLLFLNSCLDSK